MADDQNAPAAATGDNTPALSIDAAVAVMNEGDERREKAPEPKAKAEKPEPEAESETAEDDAPADEADDEPADEAESPSDEDEPDSEPEPDEEVHGNAKTRLRDGTVVAVADLKKAYGELQELKSQGPELSAQRQELDKAKADVQQRQKYLEDVLPHALRIVQSSIPPEPDKSLRETDPIEFFTQASRRAEALAEFERLDNANKAREAEQQQAQKDQFEAFVKEQQTKLIDKRPDLKDPAKAQAFYTDFIKVGADLGFSKDELDNTHDHRLIVGVMSLAEKAAKWDKLQASKPKVAEKAKDAVPVQQPGRRVAPSERKGTEVDALSKRLSTTGSIDDAARLMDKLNL